MLNKKPEWEALARHQDKIKDTDLLTLFAENPRRFDDFSVTLDGFLFDYSKHHITDETLDLLCQLAESCNVETWRTRMFNGEIINHSENRAVLHPALRGSTRDDIEVEGENVRDFVEESLKQIETISNAIRNNSAITDIVNIGIGGSDLGPRVACDALKPFADGPKIHFIANIDGHRISDLLERLKPESTVFIVASKTFTTQETIFNAQTARKWFVDAMGEQAVGDHFYAVSTNAKGVADFGIRAENTLPMRDWVGGRFSVWGTIGLPLAIAIGFENFRLFLDGAKAVDDHFVSAPLHKNIPVLMALLGIWYNNFWNYDAHAVIPYAQNLTSFPRFLQQLEMESNGKSVDRKARKTKYDTAPVLFGEAGTNAQHAFFQLLHQGTQIVPIDFIAIVNPEHDLKEHHTKLLANILAQSQALMAGDPNPEEPHRNFDGNRPSTTIVLDRLDPYHLGMLIALYEHKVFVQGIVWDINSFDQWGVELGKKLAGDVEQSLIDEAPMENADASTQNLIRYIVQKLL